MKILFIFIFVINFLFGVSFYSSIIMISKVVLIVSYSAILLFTTTTNEVALGFSSLLRPFIIFRFPVYKFSMIFVVRVFTKKLRLSFFVVNSPYFININFSITHLGKDYIIKNIIFQYKKSISFF